MRITGGQYRGRTLYVPRGRDVRPTTDKVRQAVFNILAGEGLPEGATVLDGFCGTGALGLEALSRGASFCLFLDKSAEALKACRRNVDMLGAQDNTRLMQRNLLRPGPRPDDMPKAELVFLDPPYRQGFASAAADALFESGWLAGQALCVIEAEKGAPSLSGSRFSLIKIRSYGDTDIGFYRVQYEN